MGKIELRKWTVNDKESLMAICNAADRSYLTGRLPFPYTEADADWWLKMGKTAFSALSQWMG